MKLLDIVRVSLGGIAGLSGMVLALPAIILLLPFALVDLLASSIRRFFEPHLVEWEDVIGFAPQVGWVPKPDLDVHVRDFNGDAYHVTTGPDGWRGDTSLADSEVVVFGDSYAFGCGVDDSDFFAHHYPDLRIKAIGSPAYSMVHSVLWMERLAPGLRGKLVVWFVYHGNDLVDNLHPALLHYRSPFARSNRESGEWEIVTDHVDPSRWTINSREGAMDTFVEICSPTHQSTRSFQACEFLIRRGAEVCREAGAELTVMSIPDLSPVAELALARALENASPTTDFDRGLPDRKLRDTCLRLGVPFTALEEHLDSSDYLKHDFHWSPTGNRRVAEMIGDLCRERASDRSEDSDSHDSCEPRLHRKIG